MNLEQIMMSALDAEIEQYEAKVDTLPEPAFSLKHRRNITKAIRIANESSAGAYHYRHRVKVRRIVAVALVAILVMVTSVIAFAAVYPEYYMVIKEKVKEWTITFVTDSEDCSSTDFVVRKGDIPEGFAVTKEVFKEGIYNATYTSEEGQEIIYAQEEVSENSITGLDSENDYKKIEILNGVKTVIMKKKDCYTLFWVGENCSYTLIGNCDLKLLKTFAASIR